MTFTMVLVISKLMIVIIVYFVSSIGLTAAAFQPARPRSNVFFKPQNSADCCYNDTKHEAGSIIEEFQEVCLQLVCAVRQNEFSSSAVILPVAIPNSLCTGTPCEDCYDTNCVDEAGLIHAPGSSWILSNCSRCECDAQNLVHCMPLPAICLPPPPPDSSCVEIPGPCCSTWQCPIVNNCVDSEGEIREINEVWGGPCITFFCTSEGIVTRIEDCAPLPFNDSCHPFTPEGQCCPELRCGCVDSEGQIREVNEEWGGPCITFLCTSQGIVTRIEDCFPLPLNASCHAFTPEGQCCPEIRCGGCVDSDGVIREVNEEWGGPCITFLCTSQGIVTRIEDCVPLPLNASCHAFTPEGQCCPEIRCGGCVDSEGVIREVNEEWGGPCITFLCTSQGIVTRIEDCVPLPLNASCHAFTPEGQCCPEIRCGGCLDSEGVIREVNEEWGGPCITFRCTSEGIVTRIEDCAPLPFNASCHAFTPEGQCCPELRCGICIDSEGELRELNEEWGGLCHFSTCTENGIVTHAVDCPQLPEVNETCEVFTLEGECCPQLRCGCVDEGGDFHKLDSEWHPDPCTYYRCSTEGILKATRLCKLGPKPHSSCKEVTKDNECCPEWDCEGKPSYGCVDENGEYHELGVVWYHDSCTVKTCTADGIVHKKEECEIQERPHFNCEQFVPQGKCCQEWKCGEDCSRVLCEGPPVNSTCEVIHSKLSCCPTYNCSCFDENGKRQQVGSRWMRECLSYECTDTGIIKSYIPCVLKEPEHSNCIPFVPLGECCPIWNCGINCALVRCAGPPNEKCVADVLPPLACCPTYTCPPDSDSTCVDAIGAVHEIGSVWKHNCRTYNCTRDGVKIQETSCYLSPAPHDNCKMVLYENSCCLEWECGAYSEVFPEEADLVIPIPF